MMIGKKKSTHRERFERIQALMKLAIETNGYFKIFPPPNVHCDGSLWEGDDVVERLSDTIWKIEFQNGAKDTLTFTDLILLLYNFRQLNQQMQDADEMGNDDLIEIKLITTSDPKKVLKPKVIQSLFGRLQQKRKKKE